MDDLARLSHLLSQRNAIDTQISLLLDRPATTGHLGEYIASKIMRIELQQSASHKGIDGRFADGPLAGRTVNIKFYPKHDGLLSISPGAPPDYFLVLAGPMSAPGSSRGKDRPHQIESVFIFDGKVLVAELLSRRVKLGPATSVKSQAWQQAQIYPVQRCNLLVLTQEQRSMLALFGAQDRG